MFISYAHITFIISRFSCHFQIRPVENAHLLLCSFIRNPRYRSVVRNEDYYRPARHNCGEFSYTTILREGEGLNFHSSPSCFDRNELNYVEVCGTDTAGESLLPAWETPGPVFLGWLWVQIKPWGQSDILTKNIFSDHESVFCTLCAEVSHPVSAKWA